MAGEEEMRAKRRGRERKAGKEMWGN